MKESYKKFITYSVWVTIVLLAVRCLISRYDIVGFINGKNWGKLAYNIFVGYAGEAIGIMTILMLLFNNFAWKWVSKLVGMPVLAKRYSGKVVSSWQEKNKEYGASLEVKQTFLDVSITLKTKESRSYSIVSSIDTVGGTKRIIYFYQNEPHAELTGHSAIHKGTVELWIEESGKLTGNYYTSRDTRGSMEFKPKR